MSSGMTPSIGEIAPPRTWYLPRNSPLFSIGTRSVGLSTTQIASSRRDGSAQSTHGSWSAMLKHFEHRITASAIPAIASPSSFTAGAGILSMWRARRVAVFSPIPGSRARRPTRRRSGFGYDIASVESREVHPARDLPDLLGHHLPGACGCLVDRPANEVLEQFHIVRGDDLLLDAHGDDLLAPVHDHRDHAPPRRRLDRPLAKLFPELRHPLLHLLRLAD